MHSNQLLTIIAHRSLSRDALRRLGGFDTHADLDEQLATLYRSVDAALASFVAEMKALGVWERVAVQTASEFGRTMATNGQGTDHAWGGNHVLLGGSVRGGVMSPNEKIRLHAVPGRALLSLWAGMNKLASSSE